MDQSRRIILLTQSFRELTRKVDVFAWFSPDDLRSSLSYSLFLNIFNITKAAVDHLVVLVRSISRNSVCQTMEAFPPSIDRPMASRYPFVFVDGVSISSCASK